MRTFGETWLDATDTGAVKLLVLVDIFTTSTTSVRFTNRGVVRFRATPSLRSIAPVSSELDPTERVVTISDWSLIFADDGVLRDTAAAFPLKNKRVRIKYGDASIQDETDLELLSDNLVIDDIIPEPGGIRLLCLDMNALNLDLVAIRYYDPDHPLLVARKIVERFTGPAPRPEVVDEDSYDEKLDIGTSHFVVTRHQFNQETRDDSNHFVGGKDRNSELERLGDQLNGIAKILRGAQLPNEDGKYSFNTFDRAATVDRNLTRDDVADFRQESTFQDIINQVGVSTIIAEKVTDKQTIFRTEDSQSITDFQFIHSTTFLRSGAHHFLFDTVSPWLNSFVKLIGDFGLTDTELLIIDPFYHGFCGSKTLADPDGTNSPQPAAESIISPTRPAFFKITDHTGIPFVEIVKSTSFTFPTSTDVTFSSPLGDRRFWSNGRYTVERGINEQGVGQQNLRVDWTARKNLGRNVYVYDITIPKFIAETIIDRHSRGVPIVSFRTPIIHDDLQVGDTVTVESSIYLAFGKDGSDSTTILEIISKEPSHFGDSPGIKITAAFLRQGVTPPPFIDRFDDGDGRDFIIDPMDRPQDFKVFTGGFLGAPPLEDVFTGGFPGAPSPENVLHI